jgi:hypothetical protein
MFAELHELCFLCKTVTIILSSPPNTAKRQFKSHYKTYIGTIHMCLYERNEPHGGCVTCMLFSYERVHSVPAHLDERMMARSTVLL